MKLESESKAREDYAKKVEEESNKEIEELRRKCAEEQRNCAEAKERLEKALAEIERLNSKIIQLTNTLKGEKDEIVNSLTEKLNEAMEGKKEAEDMAVMQMRVELDTPPEEQWEAAFAQVTAELEAAKKSLAAAVKETQEQREAFAARTTQLEDELKEQVEANGDQGKTQEIEMKELRLKLESAENKLKESKLDLIKVTSALDRKSIDVDRLKNIVEELENQKKDLLAAVSVSLTLVAKNRGELRAYFQRPNPAKKAIQGAAGSSPKKGAEDAGTSGAR